MEPIRRAGIVEAAIAEIGESGSLDVTVSQIARRAGVSGALAHHYFGTKTALFASVMRHILRLYGEEVLVRLKAAEGDHGRLDAILEASFAQSNMGPEVRSAWLNFYVRAQTSPEIARLLTVYHRRLRSNLISALTPYGADRAAARATGIGAMIDGIYLRQALGDIPVASDEGLRILRDYVLPMLEDRA